MKPYCSTTEVRDAATQMTEGAKSADSPTLVSNEYLLDLIERASHIFDSACGAREGYFESAYYPIWKSGHTYVVGEIVTPTTRNGHKYRVTAAGGSGASEPTWPTTSSGTVTNGTATFTEYGADVAPTARTFYGDGVNYLQLDPYVPGTLNTTLGLPENYTAPSFIERNGYLVQANSGVVTAYSPSVYSTGWWSGVPVTVTAQWGFEETPADVKAAVIELVINLWRETDPASAKLINVDGAQLRESLPPRVKAIANRWKLKVAEVVFA